MKNLNTISGRELKVSLNHSKRTATIRSNGSKYRTYPMTKEEFQSAEYNTGNDWAQFLKGNNYYQI